MRSFWKQESGDGIADFALFLALVALVLLIAFTAYRSQLQGRFFDAARTLDVRG